MQSILLNFVNNGVVTGFPSFPHVFCNLKSQSRQMLSVTVEVTTPSIIFRQPALTMESNTSDAK